jgi:phenylalanyl-tRNA synthetase alpha chain
MTQTSVIESLRSKALAALEKADTAAGLTDFQVEWLGRKGKLTVFLKSLSNLPMEDKKVTGKRANEIKTEIETALLEKQKILRQKELESDLKSQQLDLYLPGDPYPVGREHPISQVINELVRIFYGMGFINVGGPEMESEFYNFEALNIPANHPARDMQDTFYFNLANNQLPLPQMEAERSREEPVLLRTHTSPVQVRIMQSYPPPIAVVVPGRVYRHEATDATHLSVFHQLEGLLVDEGVSFADLKGSLERFAREFFGPQVRTRFRPSYFPFTEPSAEMDISCLLCDGSGCRVCKQSGWLEMMGAGLVNPRVFEYVKVDTEKYSGFAFGMGIERLAMFKYGVNDLRTFYENDVRFLEQF